MRSKTKNRFSAYMLTAVICFFLSAPASASQIEELVPVGRAVGIQLQTQGVVIVDVSEIENDEGVFSPAAAAGLKAGDVIVDVGGLEINCAADFMTAASSFDKKPVSVTVKRDDRLVQFSVTPAMTREGKYQLGLWMRDGISGIGTMTFYDPNTGVYGALGHGINDTDTGSLLVAGDGNITGASVIDIIRGAANAPGELCGRYDKDAVLGDIITNCDCGIFGTLDAGMSGQPVPVAAESEIKLGAATILSNVSGEEVREYDIEVCRVYRNCTDGKSLMIRITDEELLKATGGIVQGMSGSPIMQDGKIIGAVTHVLISDPERGYGISIEKMLAACEEMTIEGAA